MRSIDSRWGIFATCLFACSAWAAAPSGRYTIANDTVKDNKTGLTWQRAVPNWSYTWATAKSYCQGLNLGGYSSGWRLPTKKELETLVDRRTSNPSIDLAAFPNTPPNFFWSSTIFAGLPNRAWGVYFYRGTSWGDADALPNASSVRCVR